MSDLELTGEYLARAESESAHNLESGKWSPSDFKVHIVSATLPCLRETVMNIHNHGSLKPVFEHVI